MTAVLHAALAVVESLPEDRTCRACDNLGADNRCRHWDEIVPEDALDVGCDAWVNEIPF